MHSNNHWPCSLVSFFFEMWTQKHTNTKQNRKNMTMRENAKHEKNDNGKDVTDKRGMHMKHWWNVTARCWLPTAVPCAAALHQHKCQAYENYNFLLETQLFRCCRDVFVFFTALFLSRVFCFFFSSFFFFLCSQNKKSDTFSYGECLISGSTMTLLNNSCEKCVLSPTRASFATEFFQCFKYHVSSYDILDLCIFRVK